MGAQLLASVQPVYDWLVQIMMPWGLFALFGFTFLESLYLIGLFTPGEVTVVAAALVAAGSDSVPVWLVLVVAWFGGIIGTAFGYWVGRKFGIERLRRLAQWIASTRMGRLAHLDPALVDDLAEYFEHHGVMTVFTARFAYGMKSFIPPIAGATRMKFWSFFGATAAGSALYTTALVVAGWFLQQNVAVAGRIMKSLGWFAAAMFVVLFIFAFVMLRRFARKRKTRYLDKRGIPREDSRFTSRKFWKDITFFDEVTSTNDIAFTAYADGQKAPAAFIALRQTAGRGRIDRAWSSGEGGVYLSLLLSAHERKGPISSLSLVTALAVFHAYRRSLFEEGRADLVERLSIKWPNDVYLEDKKLAGILLEAQRGALVVGVGLNNRRPQESEDTAPATAAFLDDWGVARHRKQLALDFLASFEKLYESWRINGLSPMLEEYASKERNLRRFVSLFNHDGLLVDEGYCIGFNEDGALLLADSPDAPRTDARVIVSGEVSLRAQKSAEALGD